MKVVVVLCAVLPFTGRPLLTGPWLLNSKFTQHSLQGTRQKWTGLSHHAQLSMCTSRDKMAASGMEFSVLIECEFVAVVSWKVGWLCFFYHKICTRPIGRLVSQFYSSLGCFYPSGTTGRVVSSNTDSPTNHAFTPTHSEERYHRCLSSHLGLTLTLTYPISCPGNALGSSETADLVSLSCHNSAILLLITRETLPNSGKSPSWHNNCCHDATTSLCVIRVRHDNVCVRLTSKHHLRSCSPQWVSTQSDHYAVLHPFFWH